MKHLTRKLLAAMMAAAMVCLLIPVGMVSAAAFTDPIVNGGFENGAEGWELQSGVAEIVNDAHSGSKALSLNNPGQWGSAGLQTIPCEANTDYVFTWYAKRIEGTGAFNLYVMNADGYGNVERLAGQNWMNDKSTEWIKYEYTINSGAATQLLLKWSTEANKPGKILIDDFSMAKVGGDDPTGGNIESLLGNIKTQGRTAMIDGTLMLDFALSGVEFELNCEGDVYATFNARKLASTSSTGGIYFTIVVDGVKQARDFCRITTGGETKFLLAEGLSAGKHTFAIYRQSEHQYGEIGISALTFNGDILDKPADKDLYIEFIGDSISNGYGVLGNMSQGDGSALWSDATQAYNFLTAQALDADFSNPSWSGLGCKYGYSSITMQDVYPAQRYNYDKKTAYDFSKEPDIVILALGTNDNSKGPDKDSIRAGLKEMLTLVRAKNPNAPIVWIYGMMTNDLNTMIQEIVAEFGGEDAGYYSCKLTTSTNGGGWHPSVKGQQKFADELVAFIKEKKLHIDPNHVHEYDGVCDADCNGCGEIRDVHTGLVHFDAVEAGCHYIGNVEYWHCPACEGYWTDAALTQVTNSKNIIVPAKGAEVVHFEAIAPACHYNGRIEYWHCAECDQYWQDEALTQLTNVKNVILPATGSDKLQHVAAKAATETENGNIEYWFCAECEQYWQDEALTQLTNVKNVVIAATGTDEPDTPDEPTIPDTPEKPDSPETGDSLLAVVVALLALIASAVAAIVLKNKKHA